MRTVFDFFSSRTVMIVLLLMYSFGLGFATFIENIYGTSVALESVYNNLLFFVLQFFLAVNFVCMSFRFRFLSQKKWGVLLLHYGFVVILCGAMVTHLFSLEGIVHVREGATTNQLLDNHGIPISTLPFDITLNDFVLEKYSGSGSPSSFESYLSIDGNPYHVYMNNVVYFGQYRIYQSSYDSDLMGSILTVNKDLLGTFITYTGYFMLFIGMFLSLFHNGSRFRRLASGLGILVFFGVINVSANGVSKDKVLAHEFAERYFVSDSVSIPFSHLIVQTQAGRIEPIDTYARELLRKLYRKTEYGKLSATQVLLGMLSQPEVWSRVELIKVGNSTLSNSLGSSDDLVAFIDVLDANGIYRFEHQVDSIFSKSPSARNKYDKDLLKLDEQINILHSIFKGQMLRIFPLEGDKGDHWYSGGDNLSVFRGKDSMFVSNIMVWFVEELQKGVISGDWRASKSVVEMIDVYQSNKSNGHIFSDRRISAEILYNKLDLFKWTGFGYMGLGLILMVILVISNVTGHRLRYLIWCFIGCSVLLFLAQNFGMGLRWYISQRAPWTNSYESMVYIGWASILGGLVFLRRSKMVYSLALFFGGSILFVSNLSFMDPQITPLVPVLKSYWLIIHVAVITASYGFFGLGFLIGLSTIILMIINSQKFQDQIKELTTINELGLWIGLCLMTAGTFLGAIWANESWGRYWGWDPKETWALITVLVYAIILHVKLRSNLGGWFLFSVMSIFSFGSVLMTFFGVNYYLTGLHSYGSDSAPAALHFIWYGYLAVLFLIALSWFRSRKH